jgi:hypothetical protein
MNKKKEKDKLSHKQFQILRHQGKDTLTSEQWIKSTGLNVCVFNRLPVQVLQAQQVAHTLLTEHSNLLTTEQVKTLRAFKRKVGNTKNHKNLKPQIAYPVFNISNKINRQLFKQHRQLSQPTISANTI